MPGLNCFLHECTKNHFTSHLLHTVLLCFYSYNLRERLAKTNYITSMLVLFILCVYFCLLPERRQKFRFSDMHFPYVKKSVGEIFPSGENWRGPEQSIFVRLYCLVIYIVSHFILHSLYVENHLRGIC